MLLRYLVTGSPNGPVLFCLLASVVVCRSQLHCQRAVELPAAGQPTLHGGPVVLRIAFIPLFPSHIYWQVVTEWNEQKHVEPFDVSKHLSISEELGEVDVEDVAGMFDHDVVVMTITDAEDIRSHAVASTACREVIHRLHTTRQYHTGC